MSLLAVGCKGAGPETPVSGLSAEDELQQEIMASPVPQGPVKMETGKIVTVVCFYGANDHDDLSANKCRDMIADCQRSYGAASCRSVENPTQEQLTDLQASGPVIVVAHSTPAELSPDQDADKSAQSPYDIWDTPVTPEQVAGAAGNNPVIWYGCFGAGIAQNCRNVVPLQTESTVLDSSKPEIACRFRATMLCNDAYARTGRQFTQQQIQTCVFRTMRTLKMQHDPSCPDGTLIK
jgi:hypothetical protein